MLNDEKLAYGPSNFSVFFFITNIMFFQKLGMFAWSVIFSGFYTSFFEECQIWGLQYEWVTNEKFRISNKNMGISDKILVVFTKNLRSPMKIWE